MTKEFNLNEKKEGLYQDLFNNLEKAYDDKVNPIGIIQMFVKLSKDMDKESIKRIKAIIKEESSGEVQENIIIERIDKILGDGLV